MKKAKLTSQYTLLTKSPSKNTDVEQCGVEMTHGASPILGSSPKHFVVESNFKDGSPVLDSKVWIKSKKQSGGIGQSKESLFSPILKTVEYSFDERNSSKIQSRDSTMNKMASNVNIMGNEKDKSHGNSSQFGVSQVLGTTERITENFGIKLASYRFLKEKVHEEEFSPSPVLDSTSQFKNSLPVELKNVPRKNCLGNNLKGNLNETNFRANINSSNACNEEIIKIQTKETLFEVHKGLVEDIFSLEKVEGKKNNLSPNLLAKSSKDHIVNSNLTLEEGSQIFSQILGSNYEKVCSSRGKSESVQIEKPARFSFVTKESNPCMRIEGCHKGKIRLENGQKINNLSNQDGPNECCSPVLNSYKHKEKLARRQTRIKSSNDSNHLKSNYELHLPKAVTYMDQPKLNVSSSTSNILSRSVPLCNTSNATNDFGKCDQSTTSSTTCSNKSISSLKSLDAVKFTENKPPHSIFKHSKRMCSPIIDSQKFKMKKQKIEALKGKEGKLALDSIPSLPDNKIYLNVPSTEQEKNLTCLPSLNSELDISEFPLMLPNIISPSSPNVRFEKCLSDKKNDDLMSSQNNSRGKLESSYLKDISHDQEKMESSCFDKNKLLPTKNNRINDFSVKPLPFNSHTESHILLETNTSSYKNSLLLGNCKAEVTTLNYRRENVLKKDEFRKSSKRQVKRNLSHYYEEVKTVTQSVSESENLVNESETNVASKNNKNIDDDDDSHSSESQMSGVEKLSTFSHDHAGCEKPTIACEPHELKENVTKHVDTTHEQMQTVESSNSERMLKHGNNTLNGDIKTKQQFYWKNQQSHFDVNEDIFIDEFDEESPPNRENSPFILDDSKLETVKRNLNLNFEQSSSTSILTKPVIPDVNNMLPSVEEDNQIKSSSQHLSPEESNNCVFQIQEDFSQKTSERSPIFRIEYSTTPNTKSSEENQYEPVFSNPPSFPPAINVEGNSHPSADVLDSACKNKRTRVKRGSAVERLRRLVRQQRAEVNMFHHEVSALSRTRARVCSLRVISATQSCSLLLLVCRYMDAQWSSSQEFGSGEELVNPEVHVYVDTSFAKNVTSGCIVNIFPPWHSEWHESRNVVVMYSVTKLRSQPGDWVEPITHMFPLVSTQMQFTCQGQDDQCNCRSQLIEQLFTAPTQSKGPSLPTAETSGTISAALGGGWFPQRIKLTFTVLHTFQAKSRHNQLETRILGVDGGGNVCQLNLRSEQDVEKFGPLSEVRHKTFVISKLTLCSRIVISRCKGLRSFLSYLYVGSADQQLMYVASPTCDDWTAQLIDKTDNLLNTQGIRSRITQSHQQLLSLPVNEEVEGRARARVRVMAVRRDEMFVWVPEIDSYLKLNITSSAALPNFPARTYLDLIYIWVYKGELTIDKFTEVVTVEEEDRNSPTIPPLAVESTEGDLVLLDSIVTKVSSDAYLRWEGSCGHKVLRVQTTGLYFCATCRQTSASSTQKVILEVNVAVEDIPHPIRVKVKSETARVLLAESSGEISSDKSYNVIGAIGSTLKCLALVAEVLRNSLGDIIEFNLEEL